MTITQLGQLIGVATLGTLFLNRLAVTRPHPSAYAVWVTSIAMGVVALVGALAGVRRALAQPSAQA